MARDKLTVASMLKSPIDVNLMTDSGEGFRVTIRSEQEFVDKYDRIITEQDREYIKGEDPTYISYSWRGAEFSGFRMFNCLNENGGPKLIDEFYLYHSGP